MMYGIDIFNEINTLSKEVTEYERGLDALADEIGTQSPAYKFLDKMRKDKAEELRAKMYTEYEVKDND